VTGWDPLAGDPVPPAPVVRIGPGDLFSAEVATAEIERVLSVVAGHGSQNFLLCTERAKRMLLMANEGLLLPRNLWLGVTVRSDDEVWRAEDLLRCNAAHPWVAVDPMTGPVPSLPVDMLSWVDCGVASDPAPARALRDRCVAAGVPFRLRRSGTSEILALDGRTWAESPAELGAAT
jgi:protein gp37